MSSHLRPLGESGAHGCACSSTSSAWWLNSMSRCILSPLLVHLIIWIPARSSNSTSLVHCWSSYTWDGSLTAGSPDHPIAHFSSDAEISISILVWEKVNETWSVVSMLQKIRDVLVSLNCKMKSQRALSVISRPVSETSSRWSVVAKSTSRILRQRVFDRLS